ncbi:MAG TPA: alkaline phosphatase family protein [Terracidiphilus sp.]|nr:alkaline phosphatase family protein [Terracidiphilus sp.]
MERCVVLNLPGLTARYVGAAMPNLQALAAEGRMAPIEAVLPAVNCTMEATFLTGAWPGEHGIVADGWYYRDTCEIKFWPTSAKLVEREPVWETARKLDPEFTCANLCWFNNMFSSADYCVAPVPVFPATGGVLPGLYTEPMHLNGPIRQALGEFPIYNFWGPTSDLKSSRWIANAAMWMEREMRPSLSLVFLPHLDYAPHKVGPDVAKLDGMLREIDGLCGELMTFYETRGVRVLIVSEFSAVPVSRPVHLNRLFRERGWLSIREELGHEALFPGSSRAFAVADMQVAHIYVNEPGLLDEVREVVEAAPGVSEVLGEAGKRAHHLDHPRSGELIALAEPDAWFTYYFWLDDAKAPDYARTVDIIRKPGYDPVELFLNQESPLAALKYGWEFLRDKWGFRSAIHCTPLDARLLKGAHGLKTDLADGPVALTRHAELLNDGPVHATEIRDLMLAHLDLAPVASSRRTAR